MVLGILIALQIENWNEWRQEREEEKIVLQQLGDDYRANLSQLDQKIGIRNAIIIASYSILDEIDHPQTTIRDSLIGNLTILLIDPTFDPIKNDLSSNGDLRLITNTKLKRMLSNWTSDIVAVQELEQNWSTIVFQQLQPILRDLGITRDLSNYFINDLEMNWTLEGSTKLEKRDIGASKQGASVEEIAGSKELEGLVSAAITYNSSANLESQALRQRILEILSLIDKEIEE